MNRLKLLLSCLLMALIILPAAARDRDDDGRDEGRPKKGKHADMKLTDDQKSKLKAIRKEQKESRKASKEKMRQLRDQLRELLDAEKPDVTKVKTALSGIQSERKKQLQMMETLHGKMEAILSPIQMARMELHRGKGGKGKHGGDDEGGRKWRRGGDEDEDDGGGRRKGKGRKKHHEDEDEGEE